MEIIPTFSAPRTQTTYLPPFSLLHNILKKDFVCVFAESLCRKQRGSGAERGSSEQQAVCCLFWMYIMLIYEPVQPQRHSGTQQEDLIQHIWIWTAVYWPLGSASASMLLFFFMSVGLRFSERQEFQVSYITRQQLQNVYEHATD